MGSAPSSQSLQNQAQSESIMKLNHSCQMQNASVPQRWFSHFYLLGSVVNAGCIALAVAAATVPQALTESGTTSMIQVGSFQYNLPPPGLD